MILLSLALFSANVSAQQTNMQTTSEVKAVTGVDLKRYSGKWFEIARYPNKFQKNCVGNTTATYTLKSNDTIEVVNRCLQPNGTVDDAKGKAKIVENSNNAKLKVRFAPAFLSFIPAVWGDYWILDVDENYQYAVVGDPEREYLWILSRSPEMREPLYQEILHRVERMGYKPGKLIKTPQNAEAVKGAAIRKQ